MHPSKQSLADGYESLYREFDSPLMRRLRREAYGEDIGQHSWAGFRLIETEDRTRSVLRNASGRLAAMQAHRAELEQVTSAADFEGLQDYLETVVELSRRGAVSRVMYLAEVHR